MRFETRIGIVKTFRKREIPLSRLHPFRFSRKTKAVAVQANRKSGKIGRTSIFVKDRARIFIDRVKPCPSAFSVRKEGRLSNFFIYLGIACFGLSLVFQLVTLPVEFNASRRALDAIAQTGILSEDEQVGARKTLTAAALTYVAATAAALAQLLRLLVLFGNRNRRNN